VGHRGAGHIAVLRPLAAGTYDVRLTVRRRRTVAASEVGVLVGRLRVRTAQRLMRGPPDWRFPPDPETYYRHCRRFGALRIDCQALSPGESGNLECDANVSVTVDLSGLPVERLYHQDDLNCGDFQTNPVFDTYPIRFWPFSQLGVEPAPVLWPRLPSK
jgi:hypothetical protein